MTSLYRNWKASWIWPKNLRAANAHVLFRCDFTLDRKLSSFRLAVAAESYARVYLNGRLIHETTSISYPLRHIFEEASFVDGLCEGENRIGILVRYIGIPSGDSCPKDPGLLFELETDGEVVLSTDSSWKALTLDAWGPGRRRSHWFNLALIEECDLRRLPEGWPLPGIDHSFETPEVLPYPGCRFQTVEKRSFPLPEHRTAEDLILHASGQVEDGAAAQEIPALTVSEETLEPAEWAIDNLSRFTLPPLPAGKAATLILELAGYDRGYPILDIQAPEGTVVDLAWHEFLTDGRIDVRDSKVYTADRFVLREGMNRIHPWEWYTGRYLQMTFRNVSEPLKVKHFDWIKSHYPLTQQVEFRSSDKKLERIFEIGANAVRLCMQDNIMDCPWRERRQWIGDAQRIGLINHYLFGDRALLRSVLRQHTELQDALTGRMWVCLPVIEEYPLQSMEWLRAVLEYEEFTGDRSLLDEVQEAAFRLHRWFLQNRDKNGLLFITEPPIVNWLDNDFKPLMAHQYETPFLVMNLRYLLFLDDIVSVLNRQENYTEAEAVQKQRIDLAGRIPDLFLDKKTGLFRDAANPDIPLTFSEGGHALAVLAGIGGADVWDRFSAFQTVHPEQAITSTPFGKHWTFEVLGQLGREEDILREIITHWGPMVEAGADTAWERFPEAGGAEASHCHGWSGIFIPALMRHVFHTQPNVPATICRENLAGIDWMTIS